MDRNITVSHVAVGEKLIVFFFSPPPSLLEYVHVAL